MAPDSSQQAHDDAGTSQDSTLRPAGREHWADEDEETIPLGWYVRVIQRRWKLVVAGLALGGAVGFWLPSTQPIMYEGVTTLLVVSRTLPSGVQINPATFSSIVRNATLASQVIEELKLQDGLTPQAFLGRALDIEEVPATSVVKVKVRLADPRMAAEASRRLTRKAILFTQRVSQQEGASIPDQLKSDVNDAHDRLQKAEQALLSYKQHAQIELLKQDTDAMLKKRGDLLQASVDLETERARLAAAEQEIKRQQPLLFGGRAEVPQLGLASPVVNPVYQTLEVQIATSRTRIAALENGRDVLTNVKKVGDRELAQLSELYRRQFEQARLQARFDLARSVYDDLAVRYEQSRTQPVATAAPLQVLDDALPPDGPVSRRRLQYTAIGSAAGFACAVLVALLWESRGRANSPVT